MKHLDPTKRHDFVVLFDVENGNPNGDPDAGNLPRVDPETMLGLVTDVAIKRKVRNYVAVLDKEPIFIQSESALNTLKAQAAEGLELSDEEKKGKKVISSLRDKMCQEYYDIRMFGAVLSTGSGDDRLNAGQVRGPMQFTFARSIDPVLPYDISITRQARTTEERMESGETEMGRKAIVPYGLYRAHGFYNPFLAQDTGVGKEDLEKFWHALTQMFEYDRSAARGMMATRGVYVFTHDSEKGNSPAHKLFDLVKIEKKSNGTPPRNFRDYTVDISEAKLPSGVSLTKVLE